MRVWFVVAFAISVACGPTGTSPGASSSPPTSSAAASAAVVSSPSVSPSPQAFRTWSEDGRVLAPADFGFLNNRNGFADTDVAQLPDGRLRLYLPGGGGPGGVPSASLRSATSTDGLRWTPDPGARCELVVCQGGQPGLAALPSGGWRLFLNHPDGIYSAVTRDGLTFSPDQGIRVRAADYAVNPGMEITGAHVVKAKEGGWRMYFSERFRDKPSPSPATRVFSAHSADLLDWTPDAGVRLEGVIRPFVFQKDDGSYLMFAATVVAASCLCIVTSTSLDGLSWSSVEQTGLEGGDPSAFTMPDGQLRVFYNDGDAFPPGGDRIFSARLVMASWAVSIRRSTKTINGPVHLTVRIEGTGSPVTVKAIDRTRELPRSVTNLPLTGTPPLQVEFDMEQPFTAHLDQLVEVTDGSTTRLFEVPGPPGN